METYKPHWPIQKMLVMAVADRMISNRYKRSWWIKK
jgi:hypothetical protein